MHRRERMDRRRNLRVGPNPVEYAEQAWIRDREEATADPDLESTELQLQAGLETPEGRLS